MNRGDFASRLESARPSAKVGRQLGGHPEDSRRVILPAMPISAFRQMETNIYGVSATVISRSFSLMLVSCSSFSSNFKESDQEPLPLPSLFLKQLQVWTIINEMFKGFLIMMCKKENKELRLIHGNAFFEMVINS